MEKKKQGIDIVNEVLEDCILAYPVSSFIISLYKRYLQYGSLSKKQLQGLYSKASDIRDYSSGKLATLEALINKMPNRFRSDLPTVNTPVFEKDSEAARMMELILAKYPQHKRVLFLKSKYENNETLSHLEWSDLKRFLKLVEN